MGNNICFDTEITVQSIRERLEYAAMALKLKDDLDTNRLKGLQNAYSAQVLCDVLMTALREQNSNPHDLDRFIALRKQAATLVNDYNKSFKLTIAHLEQPHVAHATVPTPTPPLPAPGTRETKRARVSLSADTVRNIKKTLVECGPVISYSDCVLVAMDLRTKGIEVSDANIYQIAIGNTWTQIPWPGKQPSYKKAE